MNNIEVKVLNPESVTEARDMAICAARLTQRGHTIHSMDDFTDLFNKSYDKATVENLTRLPHPTLQKFSVINVAVVGASRRFLAQITRHQNEVKFMSASLQYSDYTDEAGITVPYRILEQGEYAAARYKAYCGSSLAIYEDLIAEGVDNDSAGYVTPQSLRNVLIISATPYQWKHMISQRTCRRNTDETRIVMLEIWDELYKLDSVIFSPETTGPFCMTEWCKEGKKSCGEPMTRITPSEVLKKDYPIVYEAIEKRGVTENDD